MVIRSMFAGGLLVLVGCTPSRHPATPTEPETLNVCDHHKGGLGRTVCGKWYWDAKAKRLAAEYENGDRAFLYYEAVGADEVRFHRTDTAGFHPNAQTRYYGRRVPGGFQGTFKGRVQDGPFEGTWEARGEVPKGAANEGEPR